METPAHDPHPDDAEFERLLAQYGKAVRFLDSLLDLPESSSRDRDVRWARDELTRIDRALDALDYSDPDAEPITHAPRVPRLPLLPGPPSWRTSLVSHHGAEAEKRLRVEADAIITRAIDEALAVLKTSPSAEPPRLLAMQVYDHHVARDERLSDHAQELLARAMPVDPRSVVAARRRARIAAADEAGLGTKEIATELGIGPRAVRARRNDQTPEDAALLAAVAEGKDLRALRPAVAEALGLLGEDGGWRTDVLAAIHDGAREPDLVRAVARAEAQRRLDGEEPNVAKRIARAARIDIRRVRRLIARSDWEMAVTVEAIRLRGNQMLRPRKDEIIAYRRGEGPVRMTDPRTVKRNPSADQ